MVREAKQNKAKDRQHKELAQARNDANTTIYQVEKSLRELNGKIPSRDRSTIERTIEDLKVAKESNDTAHIKNLSERLQQASYAIAQQMYEQRQQQPQGAWAGAAADDVVDGEFSEA